MKTINLSLLGLLSVFVLCNNGLAQTLQRENGWYFIIDGQKDSISKEPIVTVKEFVALELDSDAFGKSVILGTISKLRQTKWADATERVMGKRIGFLFNDEVITDPQVNCRIESGRFVITNPHGHDLSEIYDQMKQEKVDSIVKLFKNREKGFIYNAQNKNQVDSIIATMDYWDVNACKDSVGSFYEEYLYVIDDISQYKRLENDLLEALDKNKYSSRSSDYMRSDAYKEYKTYIGNNSKYINLMFQSFLFENVKGLYGYLIDDIIQSKYPEVPSIRVFIDKTNNKEDECSAIKEYQKNVWLQINKKRSLRR